MNKKILTVFFALLAAFSLTCMAKPSAAGTLDTVTESTSVFPKENMGTLSDEAENESRLIPEEKVTAEEFIKLCTRMHLLYNTKSMTFPEGSGYSVYLAYCKQNGIIDGSDTRFDKSERPILRSELAELIAGVFPESFFENKLGLTSLPDVHESEECFEEVLMLYNAGILCGTDERGYFCPNYELKHSELSAVFERLLIIDARLDDSLITLPPLNEAYYLIYDVAMTRSTRDTKFVSSSWNYDNRFSYAINDTGATTSALEDNYTDGYVSINRTVKTQERGILTFITKFTITDGKNGARIYFENTDGENVLEIYTKNGYYHIKSDEDTMTDIAVENKETVLKAVINLDSNICLLLINGEYAAEIELCDFKNISKLTFSTSQEDTLIFTPSGCFLFTGYYVNESFFVSTLPYDWQTKNAVTEYNNDDSYGGYVLKFDKSGSAKKQFSSIDGKVVFESYFLLPESGDTLTVSMGGISVDIYDGLVNQGAFYHDFKPHIWQCLHIEADTYTKKASLYINGKHKTDFDIDDTAFSGISFDFAKTSTSGYALIDDVEVYNIYDYPDYCPPPVKTPEDDYEVILSVCSLWREGTHSGWDFVSPYDECTPLMGYYDEGIPETADWETKLMVEHGVDAMEYCWYASNGLGRIKAPKLNWACHDGYFYGKYSDMLDFFIMWENQGFKNIRNMTLEQFKASIWDYWVEWYFRDDRYYAIDNKAVLHIYLPDNLTTNVGSEENVKAIVDFMREDILNYGYDGLILLAQKKCSSASQVTSLYNMGYDGICVYSWDASSHSPSYLKKVNNDILSVIDESQTGMYLVPTVATGRNIMGWENKRTPLATKEQHIEVLDFYKQINASQDNDYNMLYFSTWNEYGEGHWLAPSGLNGFDYLEAWRETVCNNTVPHNDVIPTQNQKSRISKLYNDTRTPIRSLLYLSEDFDDLPKKTLLSFDFEDASTSSDWWLNSNHLISAEISGGCLNLVAADRDPMFNYKKDIALDASSVDAVHIRMKCDASSNFVMYFNYENNSDFAGERQLSQTFNGLGGEFIDVYLLTEGVDAWKDTIRRVRFDYATTKVPASIDLIEFIAFEDTKDPFHVYTDGKKISIPHYYKEYLDGEYYVAADALSGFYNAANLYYEWSRFTERLYLKTASETEFEFNVGSKTAIVNGLQKQLAKPFSLIDGLPLLPLTFILDNAGIEYEATDSRINIIQRDYDYEQIMSQRTPNRYDFNLYGDYEDWVISGAKSNVVDGNLVLYTTQTTSTSTGYDPSITKTYNLLDAAEFTTVEVRLKYEIYENKWYPSPGKSGTTMYFTTTKDTTLNEAKTAKCDLMNAPVDEEGYSILTFDMTSCEYWTGTISTLRFDPTNFNGKYTIDYLYVY